jgi:hypothetical protein
MKNFDMEWPAILFASPLLQELGAKYGISGIPSLVIIDDQSPKRMAPCRGQGSWQQPRLTLA